MSVDAYESSVKFQWRSPAANPYKLKLDNTSPKARDTDETVRFMTEPEQSENAQDMISSKFLRVKSLNLTILQVNEMTESILAGGEEETKEGQLKEQGAIYK